MRKIGINTVPETIRRKLRMGKAKGVLFVASLTGLVVLCVAATVPGDPCPNYNGRKPVKVTEFPRDYGLGDPTASGNTGCTPECGDAPGAPGGKGCVRIDSVTGDFKECRVALYGAPPNGCTYVDSAFTVTYRRCKCIQKAGGSGQGGGCMCQQSTCDQHPTVESSHLWSAVACP